jgi:hypothetical protein
MTMWVISTTRTPASGNPAADSSISICACSFARLVPLARQPRPSQSF